MRMGAEPGALHGVLSAGIDIAIGVITALKEDLARPVLTGNRLAFWYALRLAGVEAAVEDYGKVFRTIPNMKQAKKPRPGSSPQHIQSWRGLTARGALVRFLLEPGWWG
jgi:hypothetical protein